MSKELNWLVASNVIFVIGGLVAYGTQINLALIAVFALVAAMAGLWRMEGSAEADLGRSFAAGGWAVLAILILLPYITVSEGQSLWGSKPYAAMTVAIAGLSMAGWNWATLRTHRQANTYLAFHVALVVAAFVLVLRGDGDMQSITFAGEALSVHDLRLAPALAAAPSLSWALALGSQKQASEA